MTSQPIGMQHGATPEVVLPPEPADVVARAAAALSAGDRRAAAGVVRGTPRSLVGWATLGDLEADDVARYAAYRVGYHRGLDTLRANGWRGAGRVSSRHETNLGFLRCLRGLGEMATAIGEIDEAERIEIFVAMLDG